VDVPEQKACGDSADRDPEGHPHWALRA
jgi:hypothetical protein